MGLPLRRHIRERVFRHRQFSFFDSRFRACCLSVDEHCGREYEQQNKDGTQGASFATPL
jgi:hypothetical protein